MQRYLTDAGLTIWMGHSRKINYKDPINPINHIRVLKKIKSVISEEQNVLGGFCSHSLYSTYEYYKL